MKFKSSIEKQIHCAVCSTSIEIKVYDNPDHPEFGQPTVKYKKTNTCSVLCQHEWQKSISWEQRIGKKRADEIRSERKMQLERYNPSTDPKIAAKIGSSLKAFLKNNSHTRTGENNPFYNKKHSEENIQHWKKSKAGKWSYNAEQKEKQAKNSPKKEKHHAWKGGISNGEYGLEFNKELKTIVKESYEYTCQLCQTKTTELDVHHIDYNKKNNSLTNLLPLCKKCHGKTNYNRDYWKQLLQKS